MLLALPVHPDPVPVYLPRTEAEEQRLAELRQAEMERRQRVAARLEYIKERERKKKEEEEEKARREEEAKRQERERLRQERKEQLQYSKKQLRQKRLAEKAEKQRLVEQYLKQQELLAERRKQLMQETRAVLAKSSEHRAGSPAGSRRGPTASGAHTEPISIARTSASAEVLEQPAASVSAPEIVPVTKARDQQALATSPSTNMQPTPVEPLLMQTNPDSYPRQSAIDFTDDSTGSTKVLDSPPSAPVTAHVSLPEGLPEFSTASHDDLALEVDGGATSYMPLSDASAAAEHVSLALAPSPTAATTTSTTDITFEASPAVLQPRLEDVTEDPTLEVAPSTMPATAVESGALDMSVDQVATTSTQPKSAEQEEPKVAQVKPADDELDVDLDESRSIPPPDAATTTSTVAQSRTPAKPADDLDLDIDEPAPNTRTEAPIPPSKPEPSQRADDLDLDIDEPAPKPAAVESKSEVKAPAGNALDLDLEDSAVNPPPVKQQAEVPVPTLAAANRVESKPEDDGDDDLQLSLDNAPAAKPATSQHSASTSAHSTGISKPDTATIASLDADLDMDLDDEAATTTALSKPDPVTPSVPTNPQPTDDLEMDLDDDLDTAPSTTKPSGVEAKTVSSVPPTSSAAGVTNISSVSTSPKPAALAPTAADDDLDLDLE